MAKELNSEFDIQARVQKSFAEATQKKIENHQALNDKEIEHLCPVAFKSTMTQKEIQNKRFKFRIRNLSRKILLRLKKLKIKTN